jgi:phospholipase/lecithinase/hemolysin
VKSFRRLTLAALIFGTICPPAHASYSSLYIFGDALSTTTNNTQVGTNYFGKRYSNGRVWVEVLAQRQGLGISNNWSYFDCNSSNLVTNAGNFSAPPNASNALFIVWVNNSDLYDLAVDNTNLATWTTAINRSQTNHFRAITNLWRKGVRTLIAPNAVDISKVPYFVADQGTNFYRQRCIAYNTNFNATLNRARAACPGLTIYSPDFFSLLNNVLTNAAYYGLTNYTKNGLSVAAIDTGHAATNGYGTNFVYWNYLNPTAKFHAVIADVAQQFISPVQVSNITALVGSNRLNVVNMPVGLNGFVDGVTNMALTNWAGMKSFNSTNRTQTIFVPSAAPQWFYRLRFPYAWSWP